MTLSNTNKMRLKRSEFEKMIKELPFILQDSQAQIKALFNSFDTIGKELVNLAMFDIDSSLLNSLDSNFKIYKAKKASLLKSLEDVSRISNFLAEHSKEQTQSGLGIKDSLIDDLQSALLKIHDTLDGEGKKQLGHLKNLITEIQTINKPVAEISENIELVQKSVDTSFEISTKTSFESMKNSIEMKAVLEHIDSQLNNFQDITEKVSTISNKITDDKRLMSTMEKNLMNSLKLEFTTLRNSLKTDMEDLINEKMLMLEGKIDKQTKETQAEFNFGLMSKDRQELNKFLEYLFTWPTNKDQLVTKIEEFRDNLLVQREKEAPYHMTAMNLFREALSLLTRESHQIDQQIVRDITNLFRSLDEVIKKSEKSIEL